MFTSDKKKMGAFVNRPLTKVVAWVMALGILGLNLELLRQVFTAWLA